MSYMFNFTLIEKSPEVKALVEFEAKFTVKQAKNSNSSIFDDGKQWYARI